MKEYKKLCDVCGAAFIAKHIKGRYCSNKCRNEAQRAGISAENVKTQKVTDEQLVDACKTLTLNEISEKYNIHPYSLPRRLMRLGVSPKSYGNASSKERMIKLNERIARGEIKPSNPKKEPEWHYSKTVAETICRQTNGQYELVEVKKGRAKIRCKECGNVIERTRSTIRDKNVICDYCKEKEQIEHERIKLMRFLYALKEKQTPKKCVVCGDTFYSQYPNTLHCSKKCRKSKGYRSRCKKYGALYDNTVTRLKVVRRDNNTCQICGKVCDENDKRWGSLGPDFPTVDHIIPLAKGGSHTWDNVQCACAMCNSAKRDLITA